MIPANLQAILSQINENGTAYLVGGTVRDILRGKTPNDYDVEVYGISFENLAEILTAFGRVSFPTLATSGKRIAELRLTDGTVYQFVTAKNEMESCAERDFSINAMLMDSDGNVTDFFGGLSDLENGILHAVPGFGRDVLRILRGIRFISRYGYQFDNQTIRTIETLRPAYFDALTDVNNSSRVYSELSKIVTGHYAYDAIVTMHKLGVLFTELEPMAKVPQSKFHHPEGNVFNHTAHVLGYAARMESENKLALCMAALLHDTGKMYDTVVEGEKVTAHGHEDTSAMIARSFMETYGFPNDVIEIVVPLVKCHMRTDAGTPSAVRRLARDVHPANIELLVNLMEADSSGRPPLAQGMTPNLEAILEIARGLNVQSTKPEPILMGRHLIQLGMQPSPKFGAILKDVYEAQLSGQVQTLEQAIQYALTNL